jgi:hypothetical protein
MAAMLSSRYHPSFGRDSSGTCSWCQVTWYGMWTARAPSSRTGRMSERSELPTITNSSALMPRRARMPRYAPASFSLTTSTPRNRSASPDRASLPSWSKRSPFVISSRSYRSLSSRTAGSTPSRSSVGSISMRLPQPRITSRSAAGIRPSVSWIAVSIIESVKAFTP